MGRTTISYSAEGHAVKRMRTGVSLHGHTSRSHEELQFLGAFRGHFPIIPAVLRVAEWVHRRATGEALDMGRTSWRPPLEPADAVAVETRQIQSLGLEALVSLSDHDDIGAGVNMSGAPVSEEWTVPFGGTFFHMGVHNLERTRAAETWSALRDYTRQPSDAGLRAALELVNRDKGVLVVLNHPLWDEAGIGEVAHRRAAERLLDLGGEWIHAIEWNGLRSLEENSRATELAGTRAKPVISGGDRHGAEPNACINLTDAGSFGEFVDEVRCGGQSTVLVMPQYREPLRLRWMQTVWDIVRPYPEAREGWRNWSDRFFYRCSDGVDRRIAEVWKTARPPLISQALAALRIAGLPRLQPALRVVFADRHQA